MLSLPLSKKRFFSDGLVVLLALFAYYFFPIDEKLNVTVQSLVLGVAFFVLLPILYVKIVRKQPLSSLGFAPSRGRFGWLAVALAVLPALALLYFFVRVYSVEEGYYLPSLAANSFPIFLLYEVLVVGATVFLYEVFFRGMIQTFWLGQHRLWAVFSQFGIFVIFLLFTDGIFWQTVPFLVATLASGFVVFSTRSLYYSWASTWLILFVADAYFLIAK